MAGEPIDPTPHPPHAPRHHHAHPPNAAQGHYRKDLGHLSEEEVWERQKRRAPLADHWWRLAGARPGWRVLDVGSGPGWFALEWARRVGPAGSVLAVDLRAEPLAHLAARGAPNVRTLQWDVEDKPLPERGFDLVVATDVLHHAERPADLLARLRGAGQRLLVAEFAPEGPGEMGPPPSERIARDRMARMLREAGWEPQAWEDEPFEHYAVLSAPRS